MSTKRREKIEGTVLLVEDEAELRGVLADYLGMLGVEVFQAKNGAEALRKLETLGEKVTAVITDAVMPDMNGIELMAAVRTRRSCKLILMSGYADAEPALDVDQDQTTVFMLKPFKLKDLADRLRMLVSGESVPK